MAGAPASPSIVACASALPAESALLRLSGEDAREVLQRAGLEPPGPWRHAERAWPLAGGSCPCRVLFAPAGRSYTGEDLIELLLPGAPDLVELALARLRAAGAEDAGPGDFTRRALAHGRIDLDQAEAVLALSQASDEAEVAQAIGRLRGALRAELEPVRQRLLALRARVEAGLDFVEEEDVRAFDPAALARELGELRGVLRRWRRAADSLGREPVVCIAGPSNAGKSALFSALSGERALVDAEPGTTRDWLEAVWHCGGRRLRLIDTAGWLDRAARLDAAAIEAGRRLLRDAALVLLCSAPDAPLDEGLLAGLELAPERCLRLAGKADLGVRDERAQLAVSALEGSGLDQLRAEVAARIAAASGGDPRQQRLLADCDELLAALAERLPEDLLLAEELRRASDLLAELLGATDSDEVLGAIFARFCIGK